MFVVGELAGWRLKAEDGTNLTSTVRPSPTGGILYVNQNPSQVKYFEAPAKFLGNQLMSYGQLLNVEVNLIFFLLSFATSLESLEKQSVHHTNCE